MRSRRKQNEKGAAALTVLILAVSGIYLTFRAWSVAHMVLAPPSSTSELTASSQMTTVNRAIERDVELVSIEKSHRDPFNRVQTTRRPTIPRPPAKPPAPELRMILYDQLSPEVQFSVDGDISGRLTPGQSFRGWTVVSISARSCIVQKGGESLTLTPRR
jgi:hypothetical protein